MADIVFAAQVVEQLEAVRSERVPGNLMRAFEAIAAFPRIGSANLPQSVVERFGFGVRKFYVEPYDIIYEYHDAEDSVHVYGLVHYRATY